MTTCVQDYDPELPLGAQPGLEALRAIHQKLLFLEDTSATAQDGAVRDAVQLMTLHKAKGLEFSVVALVGLDQNGVFPMAGMRDYTFEEQEQRKNMVYVGVTRTRNLLVVSSVDEDAAAAPRGGWKKGGPGFGPRPGPPSLFLAKIYDSFGVPRGPGGYPRHSVRRLKRRPFHGRWAPASALQRCDEGLRRQRRML